jgi:hypothetical protein
MVYVVLEKDGEDKLDGSFQERRGIRKSQRGEDFPTKQRRKGWSHLA